MSQKVNSLLEQRVKLVADMRGMLDTAEKDKRELTAEESTSYKAMESKYDALSKEIEETRKAEQDAIEMRTRLEEREKAMKTPEQRKTETFDKEKEDRSKKPTNPRATEEYRAAFAKYLSGGEKRLKPEEIEMMLPAEERALQADSDPKGGFLVASEQFVNSLIVTRNNLTFVRRYATIYRVVKASSLGAPALDSDPADPTWTAEIKTGTEDSTMDFDKRVLFPHPLAKRIKVSNKLLRVSMMPVDAIVADRFAYKFAVVEENAFLNGTGVGQPLGIFTASAQGISTARDAGNGTGESSAAASAVYVDGLIACKYKLTAQYRAGARWIFHRDVVKQISKLKDGEGNYIWQPSIRENQPDMLLGFPVDESEYAPSTYTSGYYIGALCNWSLYWIADALDMQVQVLDQLYAETNQTGYIMRRETDGMAVDENGFVRVKLAA